MKARFFIICFLVIVISLTFSDCKEPSPTIVKGKVVDFYTNAPLAGVAILIYKFNKEREQYLVYATLYSDVNGNFEFVEEENLDFYLGEMRKNGYLPKQNTIDDYIGKIKKNDLTEAVIPLIPLDSWLSLTVNKISSGKSKIYIGVFSHILKSEIGISQGRVPLMKDELDLTEGQTYTQFPLVASNEILTIHWDFEPLIPWSPFSTPYRDSVFVTRGDTSAVTISY